MTKKRMRKGIKHIYNKMRQAESNATSLHTAFIKSQDERLFQLHRDSIGIANIYKSALQMLGWVPGGFKLDKDGVYQ